MLYYLQNMYLTKDFSIEYLKFSTEIFFKQFYLFLFLDRGEGREKEREININQLLLPQPWTWPATQACVLTRNQTGDLSVCRMTPNPLSHTSQSPRTCFY